MFVNHFPRFWHLNQDDSAFSILYIDCGTHPNSEHIFNCCHPLKRPALVLVRVWSRKAKRTEERAESRGVSNSAAIRFWYRTLPSVSSPKSHYLFGDLLADKLVDSADAIRSLSEWSAGVAVDSEKGKKGKKLRARRLGTGKPINLNFRHSVYKPGVYKPLYKHLVYKPVLDRMHKAACGFFGAQAHHMRLSLEGDLGPRLYSMAKIHRRQLRAPLPFSQEVALLLEEVTLMTAFGIGGRA
ncbi:hypothetical protein B0H11DRAFT_1935555 [Mycena galericulata]|nr:hypothetical protein B0H11DRAFT_1935555 [Mycena galericulata]